MSVLDLEPVVGARTDIASIVAAVSRDHRSTQTGCTCFSAVGSSDYDAHLAVLVADAIEKEFGSLDTEFRITEPPAGEVFGTMQRRVVTDWTNG
jgi:hypothetical protein